jgi:hypothetical protein
MKTLYGEPYWYLNSVALDVPEEKRRVGGEEAGTALREGVVGGRRGIWWWGAVVLLGLMASVWPASHVVPVSYNWWPHDILRAGWGVEPGLGSTIGNSTGYVFALRGKMVEAANDTGGAMLGHWHLEHWYGWVTCGMGTRQWGYGKSPKHLEQRGVMAPAWMVSVPAGVVLAVMWGKRRREGGAG